MTLKFNAMSRFGIRCLKPKPSDQKMSLYSEKYLSTVRLDGKTAIITGCNTGIGKYNVLDFYSRGCHVVMACRNLIKAEEAKSEIEEQLKGKENLGSIVVEKLDLSSLKSVREFAEVVLQKEAKIHFLINNAGVMACPKGFTEDGYEIQFATNHLGHFLLTLLLLPRIIQSAPARIINLSSLAHRFGSIDFDNMNWNRGYSPAAAYSRSKLANVLFTKELARRLEGKPVTVYAVHPGVVNTEIGRHIYIVPGFRTIYRSLLNLFLKSVENGAQTQIYCALDEKAGQESGLYYSDCRETTPSGKARDSETAKKLWDVSWDMVKLGNFDPFQENRVPRSRSAWEANGNAA